MRYGFVEELQINVWCHVSLFETFQSLLLDLFLGQLNTIENQYLRRITVKNRVGVLTADPAHWYLG